MLKSDCISLIPYVNKLLKLVVFSLMVQAVAAFRLPHGFKTEFSKFSRNLKTRPQYSDNSSELKS